jgi:hypothetical protein
LAWRFNFPFGLNRDIPPVKFFRISDLFGCSFNLSGVPVADPAKVWEIDPAIDWIKLKPLRKAETLISLFFVKPPPFGSLLKEIDPWPL